MPKEAVALYLRLSREDEERKAESESITNQRDFLSSYVQKVGWSIKDIYIDDGYSGTNFDRPAFTRLINDIEKGRIDTVITKDLSRLGRDYIQTGYYLEKYFPSKGVRFIALNDGIDTGDEESGNSDITPFRAVINDMYAKDISKKVRTALTTKKINGKFIGSFAPYGYKKDPNDKGHLIIDEDTAPIVLDIYKLYLEGNSLIGIAKLLTKRKVPTPSQTKSKLPTQRRFEGLWNDVIIRRILTNETYIGNLVQNRTKKISYKVNKKLNLKKEDWIKVPGTHEPIILKDDFETVQMMLSKRNYIKKEEYKGKHLLSGIVFCGDCGAPMTFINENPKRIYLACSAWKKYGKLGLCSSHCVREDYVEKVILNQIRQLIKGIDIENIINRLLEKDRHKEIITKELLDLQSQSKFYKDILLNLYKDKVKGTINEEQYIEMQQKIIDEQLEIENQLMEKNTILNTRCDLEYHKKKVLELLDFNNIERSILLILVNRVDIFKNNINLHLNFKKPL